ncbi:MAG: hypothetical protein IJW99_04770 [Clostridia bacterium]|nr:hypothetical protein [Clostridia bacterium]
MRADTLDKIWNKIIIPTFNEMNRTHGGLCCPSCGKESFKIHYDEQIRHAKELYMRDSSSPLNRHKVAAAIMIAILKTKPIKKVDMLYYQPDSKGNLKHWPFNEALAISAALSVLRAFILGRVDYAFSGQLISRQIFCNVIEEDKDIFKNDIPISMTERMEWEWELYQVRQDGAYNLLSIAHILKLIERNCRYKYLLDNGISNPKHPDEKYFTDESVEILTLDSIL